MNDLAHYLELPYTKVLRRDEEGDVIASIAELDGCIAHGSDDIEALANLREAQSAWLENAIFAGLQIPKPEDQNEDLRRFIILRRQFDGGANCAHVEAWLNKEAPSGYRLAHMTVTENGFVITVWERTDD